MTHFVEVPNFPELDFGQIGEEGEHSEKEGANLIENRNKGSRGEGGYREKDMRRRKRSRKDSL